MFIAHLPAGYIASSLLAGQRPNRRGLIATGLIASGLPDTDLLWFYLVDNRQTAHHEYIFHWPLFWTGFAVLITLIALITKQRWTFPFIAVALTCLLLHMLLDSFAAEIFWLRPFSDAHLNVVEVPARFDWWVWNFILHWTFFAEIVICFSAGLMLWRKVKRH